MEKNLDLFCRLHVTSQLMYMHLIICEQSEAQNGTNNNYTLLALYMHV